MFIEITPDGKWHPNANRPFLLNVGTIAIVQERDGGSLVITKDMTYYVVDKYEVLKRRLP